MVAASASSVSALPSTLTRLGTGTMVSPWEPSVIASTLAGLVSSSSATKCLKRAVSSMPAWPITRSLGNPDTSAASAVISSSGLDTTMMTASGEPPTNWRVTSLTIFALVSSRSILLMPGLRGRPAVITHTSEPAVSWEPLLPTIRVANPSIGRDWFMSSASPCGSPSTMSVITTSSASPFSAMRWTVVEPYLPAPTTVTFMLVDSLPLRCGGLPVAGRSGALAHRGDDRVGDVAGADGGGVVAVRLHVVGDAAALGDDLGEPPLQPVGGLALAEVAEHQHAGEHHRHRVDLVLALVLWGRSVRGLEHRHAVAHVGARGDTEPADQTGCQVREDVPVEVGQQQHVEVLRLLHQLHGHVVHQVLVVFDLGVVLGHLATDRVEETVGVLHDVRLGHGGDLLAAVGARVVEGELGDPAGAGDRDRLDRQAGVLADAAVLQAVEELDHLLGLWAALLELDAGVEVLVVLTHDHQVDVLVARAHALVPLAGTQARKQIQLLAQRHVDAAEARPDRRGQRALDGDAVGSDRLEHRLRQGGAVFLDDVGAGLLYVPFEVHTGPFKDAPGGFRQLGTDSVSRDEGDTMGHLETPPQDLSQRVATWADRVSVRGKRTAGGSGRTPRRRGPGSGPEGVDQRSQQG